MNIIKTNFKWNGVFSDNENKPTQIVLHHAKASKCTAQDIHRWHLNNGWAGIGYHYFIRKDGTIYKGREDGWRGSHCPPANYSSIGICFEGDYDTETMPMEQYNSGIELMDHIKNLYNISTINGHRELYATSCPGSKFPLNAFREHLDYNKAYGIPNEEKSNTEQYNAVIINSNMNTYDKNGNIEPGRRVDKNDKITVIDISYSRQMVYVEYPISSGKRKAYIKNTNIKYVNDHSRYVSGKKVVYDYFDNVPIGSVFNEYVTVLSIEGNKINIAYDTNKGKNTKSGVIYI